MRVFRLASDELLVARVRSGSAPAFEALFQRHERPLHAFCRHMLGSAADAEDAVQHTFMAAYADLMRSDRPIALRPWLYTIARHRCLSVLRARRERPVAELPEPEVDDLATAIDSREELRATLTDIAHLPEDQRAALVLTELGDASHAEIAQVLGCRQEKVKALVFQARSTLASGRTARDTPCAEIREQLAAGGVALRRTSLRRHVRDCDGCREFGEQLRVQRRRLRILLPVAPGLGFKRALAALLPAAGGGGAAAGAGGLAATAIVTAAIAGGGADATATPPATAAPRPAAATAATAMPMSSARRRAARPTRTQRTRPVVRSRPVKPTTRGRRRIAPRRPEARRPQPPTAPSAAAPTAVPPPSAPPTAAPAQPGVGPAEPPGQAKRPRPPGPPADRPRPERPGRPPEPPGKPAAPPAKPAAPPGKPAEPPAKPAEPPGKPADPPGHGVPVADPPAGGRDERPHGRPEDAGRKSP